LSDIALVASVDFTQAEGQVNDFVTNTKRKLSTIMAAATGAGGSLSGGLGAGIGGGRSGGASGINRSDTRAFYRRQMSDMGDAEKAMFADSLTRRRGYLNEVRKYMRMEGALSQGNIGLQRALEKQALAERINDAKRYLDFQKGESARITAVQRARTAEEVAFQKSVNAQASRERRAYSAMFSRLIADENAKTKAAAEYEKSEAARVAAVRMGKTAEEANFQKAVNAQASRERRSYSSMISRLIDEETAKTKAAAEIAKAEAARVADVRKTKAAEEANFQKAVNAQASRDRRAYSSMFSRLIADETAKTKAAANEAVAQRNRILTSGGANLTFDNLTNKVTKTFGAGTAGEAANTDKLSKALREYIEAVNRFGNSSVEAARKSVAWKTAINDVKRAIDETTAAAAAAKRTTAGASSAPAGLTASQIAAEQRRVSAAQRATIAAQNRNDNAVTTVSNRALGLTNRIERQVEDPRLQAELLNRVRVSAGDATKAIRDFGVGTREATTMQNAFRMEARAVGDAITRHNGLFRQLRENTNTLNGSINTLGGGMGGLRRMILNTQVAMGALTAAFGIREILQTAQTLETVQNTLAAVSPTAQAAASNFQFLRQAGEAVGFSYLEAGRSFAQFTAASMAAGASTEQSQQAFLRLTMASRNLGLSAADTDGVIRAMTQSLSKGRFSAEEIRQQLGDRLPIAMAALERATGKSGEELDRMMRDGRITTSQFAVPFIEALLEMSGGLTATQRASLGLSASLGRLNNAWADSVLGNPSLSNGLKTIIDALTKFLNSSFAGELFSLMSKALDGLGRAMSAVVDIANQHLTPVMMRLNAFLSGDLTTTLNAVGGFLGGAFLVAVGAATAAVVAFSAAWAMTPIGRATLLIGGLTSAFMVYKDEMVTLGPDTARVVDIIVATYEYLKSAVTQVLTDIATAAQRDFAAVTQALTTAAGLLGPILYDIVTKLAVVTDAAIDLMRFLPTLVRSAADDIGGYFGAMGNNVVAMFRNLMFDVAGYTDALIDAVRAAWNAISTGDVFNIGQAVGTALVQGIAAGEARAQANYVPMQTFTSQTGATISTFMQTAGSTAAQDFVTNFGTHLNSLGTTIGGALSGAFSPQIAAIMQAASARLAAEVAAQAAMAGAAATTGANPPTGSGGLPNLLGTLAPGYGRPGAPPTNRASQGARNSLTELMQDLRRQVASAGRDEGAAQAYATVLDRIRDAATTASSAVATLAQEQEAHRLVTERLAKEGVRFVRDTNRTAARTNFEAAALMESAEAGQAAEIRTRAYAQALKYVEESLDDAGNATGEYLRVVNLLTPALENAERAERNRAAARQIDSNRDELAIIELETRLVGANTNAIQEEVAALRARQATRGASPEAVDAAERSARQLTTARLNSEQLSNSWQDLARMGEQAFDRIGSAITEAFANGKISSISFAKIAKAMISEVIQAMLRLAVINPMLNSMFGGTRGTMDGLFTVMNSPSFGASGGGLSAAGLAATGGLAVTGGGAVTGGAASGGGGGFGGLGGLTSFFGGGNGSVFSASKSFGNLFGSGGAGGLKEGFIGADAAGIGYDGAAAGAGGFGSALGGIAGGFAIGSTLGGFIAGKSAARQQNSQIGAGVGAIAGSFFGPIGSIVGGAAGGALGGLIGPGKGFSGGDALIGFDDKGMLSVNGYAGKNFEQQAELMAQAKQQTDEVNAKLKALGLSFTGRSKEGDFAFAIGGGESGNPTDIGGAMTAFKFGGKSLTSTNKNVMTAIGSNDGKKSVTEAMEAADWVLGTFEPLTDTSGAFAKTMKDLTKSFDDAVEKTKELGLSEADLAKARAKALSETQAQRDAQLATAISGVDARGLRLDGSIYGNRRADMMEYDARAQGETLAYRKTLEDLSITDAEMSANMARLTEVQGKEREAIYAKYETDIRNWVIGTYNVLTNQTSSFEASLRALNEQYDTATAVARELGYSELALSEARQQASADLYAVRDAQMLGLRQSLTVRNLRLDGTDASNKTADLMEFDLSAVQERMSFKKAMFDLGMTAAEISIEMVRLEETLGAERLSIIKKYADAIADVEREKRESAQEDAISMLDGISEYIRGLRTGDSSPLDAQAQYRLANSEFGTISAKAAAGDANAMAKLTGYADIFINASRNLNGSGTTYVQDFDRVVAALEQVVDQGPDTLTASFMARTTENQTTTLVASLTAVKEEITALRREVRQQATTPERVS
jgi:tape measure domain-containing protein